MNLADLLLKKEEIRITTDDDLVTRPGFYVPIHPKLLDPQINLDPERARKVFPVAAKEWHEDLTEYIKKIKDKKTKEWIKEVFLGEKLVIKKEYDSHVVYPLHWRDDILHANNGFTRSLCISRNAGGTLYFLKEDGEQYIGPGWVDFTPEKFLEYSAEHKKIEGLDGVRAYVYSEHNIDYIMGAIFLRNWAILYLNEALKQADAQKPF